MDLGLANKVVIVTGATRGIGRAIAREFAREGAHLAICGRTPETLESARVELAALGGSVHARICDVSDPDALGAFLEGVHAAYGRVDVLVNNPSGFGSKDDEAGWAASFNVDMMASVRATWKVIPWMEAQGAGAIVHITSIAALESGWGAPYAAAKAALITHAKTLAATLAPKGIRINCVAPGSIEFPGGGWERARLTNPARYEGILRNIPFGRLGSPEEVAAAAVFLCSARASWISGVNLVVDGMQHKGIF